MADARRELEIRGARRAFVERPTRANWAYLVRLVQARSPEQVAQMDSRFSRKQKELTP
jgi:hypothetical protein